jgi:hypothetical protein
MNTNEEEQLESNDSSDEEEAIDITDMEEEQLQEDTSFSKGKRSRATRTYPARSFTDSLELGAAISQYASGGKVRLLTLMEKMERSTTSGSTRQMITNSTKYGITKGSYKAEWFELTPEGKVIFDESQPPRLVLQAKFTLAIEKITPFKKLYDEYVRKRLPAPEVMRDFLQESGERLDDYKECIDLFIVNVKDLGLLRTIGGSETLISVDQAIDELPEQYVERTFQATVDHIVDSTSKLADETELASSVWNRICFYITPIGEEGSDQRKHSDLFLGSLVEPAVSELNLQVVRADKIGHPGMITTQIIEHVKQSRLVIVDLSFLNPNVMYEMALRHACKLPIVHIIRKADQVPFDVSQIRCVIIDNTDIYTFVPKLQTYRAEIATQARKALEDPEHGGNPITIFHPEFWNNAK